MENVKKRASSGGDEVGGSKQEVVDIKVGGKRTYHEIENLKSLSSSPESKDFSLTKQVAVTSNQERSTMGFDSKASSSNQKEQDDQLESARAEMGEVREENQRLKSHLDRLMKDYKTLQMQFYDIIQKDETINSTNAVHDKEQAIEESELVSLSLGRFSSDAEKNYKLSSQGKDNEQINKGLSLGLDNKFEASKCDTNESLPNASPVNSFEESKEEGGETWQPSKVLKMARNGDDEALQQNAVKKARVSVRARCETPTMNDGCQWRKYGQKISKGNPCPRAYYRCTVAPSCPVRKQVQRCPEDMSILVTTYEGTHNHPLPISATAMASTTSAAASMLLSGSSSSSQTAPTPSTTTAAANLHGLNFYLSDTTNSKQFYLHNSSLSASPSHPTITLDLTSTPSSSSSHLINRSPFSSNYTAIPKFASTSLNFSSSESNPIAWFNNVGFLSYGSTSSSSQSYNRNQHGSLSNLYQSYTQKNNNYNKSSASLQTSALPVDPIVAATKAITADPSFQSALAAALTSIIGSGGGGSVNSVGGVGVDCGGDSFGQRLKWAEQFAVASGYSTNTNGNNNANCASSYLNKVTSSTSSQAAAAGGGSLMFLPPALPISSPRSAAASPGDNIDHTSK